MVEHSLHHIPPWVPSTRHWDEYSIAYCCLAALGLLGNLIILCATLGDVSLRRSSTCVLISILAISDSASLLSMVLKGVSLGQNDWIFFTPTCYIFNILETFGNSCPALILILMACSQIEELRNGQAQSMPASKAVCTGVALSFLGIGIALPNAVNTKMGHWQNSTYCLVQWPTVAVLKDMSLKTFYTSVSTLTLLMILMIAALILCTKTSSTLETSDEHQMAMLILVLASQYFICIVPDVSCVVTNELTGGIRPFQLVEKWLILFSRANGAIRPFLILELCDPIRCSIGRCGSCPKKKPPTPTIRRPNYSNIDISLPLTRLTRAAPAVAADKSPLFWRVEAPTPPEEL